MSKSYKEITSSLSKNLGQLRSAIPDVAKCFSTMAMAATQDAVLSKKTKELIALAIGVSARCDGCIGFHIKTLIELGATREEIAETMGMCMYMGGGPVFMYAADALAAFDELSKKD
ncbi:carboxymuconolactone decarboxylase family protein [Candidatus Deianiraea vastatrix]|uniref:Carboxymuconolactone decarboxylase family protein n=1 Tax=Candidatus Deianiraea vastatrix TaxID=2163644 RepID=A0A5B8XEV5_9RICK|nr:carboxymuconolactone decarboxylase family protein [Candidatus Deianiraea vastatrix]QED23425.1 Carboxymuconolactone decarboxylase family protein [Candidatus Deianiraea vastatrix]